MVTSLLKIIICSKFSPPNSNLHKNTGKRKEQKVVGGLTNCLLLISP